MTAIDCRKVARTVEPIARYGPFIMKTREGVIQMKTREGVIQAFRDDESGRF